MKSLTAIYCSLRRVLRRAKMSLLPYLTPAIFDLHSASPVSQRITIMVVALDAAVEASRQVTILMIIAQSAKTCIVTE